MIRKVKLLATGRSMSIGGVEKALLSLINTLNPEKYEVDLLLMLPEGEYLDQIAGTVRILSTPKEFEWINLPKGGVLSCVKKLLGHPVILFYFLKNILYGVLRRNMGQARQRMWRDCYGYVPKLDRQYDVALDFSGQLRRYVLENVSSREKYTWIHSDYRVFGLDKRIDEELLARFDAVFCVSATCKEIFDAEYPALKLKSKVLHNLVDRNLIMKQIADGGFSDNFSGVRLLDITRLDPNKGLDIAVRVCRRLKEQNIDFRWYILGNDPLGYKQELEKLIAEHGVQDRFILLGFTANPYPYIYQADVIVHFSRFEGRSVSIDEALVLCKPVILTDYPTAKDQITDGVNGVICDFDEDRLVSKLSDLICHGPERRKYTAYLKEHASFEAVLPF